MKNKKMKIYLFSICTTLLISGCTVQPKVITKEEKDLDIRENLAYLSVNSTEVTQAISLNEAINRAIEYNIEKKVSIMESVLSKKEIDSVTYDSLPQMTINAGYSIRNNYAASASTSFTDGQPDPLDENPSYSVSQAKEKLTSSIGFSWNILDFGLSYIRAKQQSDKYLIAKEREKKVIHNITKNVRKAYYEALSASQLIDKIEPIMIETRKAIELSKKAQDLRVKSSMESLTYQRELHDILRSLNNIRRTLITSKTVLSELMGLKPGTKFELVKLKPNEYKIPILPLTLAQMEKLAIESRPEVQESRYKQRITDEEITAVKLSILPRFGINSGLYYDDSKYLQNGDWFSYGATVSWNLFDLFGYNNRKNIAQSKFAIAKQQKLAIYMAVLSQVHLSYVKFKQLKNDYKLAKEYLNIADEIFKIVKSKNELDLNNDLVFIKEKLNYILAMLRHSSSYAQMQNSYGELMVSVGNMDAFKNAKMEKDDVKDNFLAITEPQEDTVIDNTIEHKEETKKEEKKKEIFDKKPMIVAQTKSRAKVRKEPDTKSDYVEILEKDTSVIILGKVYSPDSGFWYKTKKGYMHSRILYGHRKTQWED
jgi:outer membrane protein TolC